MLEYSETIQICTIFMTGKLIIFIAANQTCIDLFVFGFLLNNRELSSYGYIHVLHRIYMYY